MKKIVQIIILSYSIVSILKTSSYSAEILSPATQMGSQKVHAEIYYRALVKQDLNISVSGTGSVVVRGSTLPTSSVSDLASEGSGSGVMAKISFQPFDNPLQFYVQGGGSTYDLKLPSGTFSNSYSTEDPGIIIGGGFKYTLVPYTMVTPAVSIDLSASHSRFKLTHFSAGDGRLNAEAGYLLTIFELQGALSVSKKFVFKLGDENASLDPYCGVKVIRTRSGLDDLSTGAHYSGTKTGVAPYVGIKFIPFKYTGLVVEGSFINELSASVGLTLGF